jgi:alpha-D-ribose 1-methylphosphonate 5-phosphate C-P lyase
MLPRHTGAPDSLKFRCFVSTLGKNAALALIEQGFQHKADSLKTRVYCRKIAVNVTKATKKSSPHSVIYQKKTDCPVLSRHS